MRSIVDENNTKWTVEETGLKSGSGSIPPGGNFVKPTRSTVIFMAEDGQQVLRVTAAGAIDHMTDDELLALLKEGAEESE